MRLKKLQGFETEKKVVFAAMSRRNFFMREHIVRFILKKGFTPTCAFMMYSYYLLDTVDHKALIRANNDLIRRSDELWVFGEVSSGVMAEIDLALELKRPVRYFDFEHGERAGNFREINFSEVKYDI